MCKRFIREGGEETGEREEEEGQRNGSQAKARAQPDPQGDWGAYSPPESVLLPVGSWPFVASTACPLATGCPGGGRISKLHKGRPPGGVTATRFRDEVYIAG